MAIRRSTGNRRIIGPHPLTSASSLARTDLTGAVDAARCVPASLVTRASQPSRVRVAAV